VPMITIPGGEFGMGCGSPDDPNCSGNYHIVSVATFEIDRYEVQAFHYQACKDAGVCAGMGSDSSHLPARGVDWYQAGKYCTWVGKRLPTSAEWEKAARGTEGGHMYPWGDTWDPLKANWCDGPVYACDGSVDGYQSTAPIDAFPAGASPYGVEQMAGNQMEWVADLATCDYGECAIVRGGSWGPMGSPTGALVTWFEGKDPLYGSAPHLGVRCAR